MYTVDYVHKLPNKYANKSLKFSFYQKKKATLFTWTQQSQICVVKCD